MTDTGLSEDEYDMLYCAVANTYYAGNLNNKKRVRVIDGLKRRGYLDDKNKATNKGLRALKSGV